MCIDSRKDTEIISEKSIQNDFQVRKMLVIDQLIGRRSDLAVKKPRL